MQFGRIAATIAVTSMRRALAFYVDVLGMTKTFENGEPVRFAILERDAAELHLALSQTHHASDQSGPRICLSPTRPRSTTSSSRAARGS